ncbi:hypothetical protein L1987_63472 [Smallanthus sonchifolius]|uniref:Uncharacterized protein n=1 Tax=Smallanthus sonchifolius TaxID=185202 RepID=A0ACB9CDD9_9ASTR|nr:hypothetical protein L1987_63472 [Smallanthus sonchifolius]
MIGRATAVGSVLLLLIDRDIALILLDYRLLMDQACTSKTSGRSSLSGHKNGAERTKKRPPVYSHLTSQNSLRED